MITPIICLEKSINNIYIKRDDLLPFSFGGNKYRIALKIIEHIKEKGYDCVVGYGSKHSNFCRVISNLAYNQNLKCCIISPEEESNSEVLPFNSIIVKECEADIVTCEKANVSQTIISTLDDLKKQGYNPYYVFGNEFGVGNEVLLSSAYQDVYSEIKMQENELAISFDYLFLPIGTGMTMSGLIVGNELSNSNTKIVGMSIARKKELCNKALFKYFNGLEIRSNTYEVCDDYLSCGYGKFDTNITKTILYCLKKYGIPLDPVYTGKAFYAMNDYIEKNNIQDKNILFLHTGGTPIFFDYLRGIEYEE